MKQKTAEITTVEVEGKQIAHMAFDTQHMSKSEFIIKSDNSFLNGRKFYSESVTKKRRGQFGSFGKTETIWYFGIDTEIFKTGVELLKSIGCQVKESDKK